MTLPTSLASELITLGYLNQGGRCGSELHALRRFQRRALTSTRMLRGGAGISVVPTFRGSVTGRIDQLTVDEIRLWLSRNYVAPLGLWRLSNLTSGGRLRDDAAQAWNSIVSSVAVSGGTLAGPYGDTLRHLTGSVSVGASRYSFHYAGRAVDINQGFGGGRGQRYYIVKELVGAHTYWRIYCKTDDQSGVQGTRVTTHSIQAYRFGDGANYYIPEGYYIDLTSIIQRTGNFERIHAQNGWGPSGAGYRKSEWWHFQYAPDKQQTFQDEVELIGITEKRLRDLGYSNGDLDHAPG